MVEEKLYGVKEIARFLNKSTRSVDRYIAKQEMPVQRFNGRIEIDLNELMEWKLLHLAIC